MRCVALTVALGLLVAPVLRATFSIVAYDAETGDVGVAVQSRVLGVGSIVPWAEAGTGAVATQALANVRFGPGGLRALRDGQSPEAVRDAFVKSDSGRARRQFLIVDAKGRTAAFTGADCFEWAGHHEGVAYAVAGNILAGEGVVKGMAEAFEKARSGGGGELAEWLLAALQAGQAAGGDKRGQQSAALLVMRKGGGYGGSSDRHVDLRVEDHAAPIDELERLLKKHRVFFRYQPGSVDAGKSNHE